MGTEVNVTVCLAGVVLAVGVGFVMDAVMTRLRQSRERAAAASEEEVVPGVQTFLLP